MWLVIWVVEPTAESKRHGAEAWDGKVAGWEDEVTRSFDGNWNDGVYVLNDDRLRVRRGQIPRTRT